MTIRNTVLAALLLGSLAALGGCVYAQPTPVYASAWPPPSSPGFGRFYGYPTVSFGVGVSSGPRWRGGRGWHGGPGWRRGPPGWHGRRAWRGSRGWH